MLGLEETSVRLANANRARWYGLVLRMDNDDVVRTLHFEAVGRHSD